jgi:hypothetical protein
MRARTILSVLILCLAGALPAWGELLAWDPIELDRAPGPRAEHAMAYDPARRETVLVGGRTSTGVAGDTWVLNATGWDPRTIGSGLSPRRGHAMAYHASLRRILLFGGRGPGEDEFLGDTWIWVGGAWQQGATSPAPPARSDHTVTYDSMRNVTVLFGGRRPGLTAGAHRRSDETWEWNGMGWELCTSKQAPPARWGHAAAYDSVRHKVVLFGGEGEDGLLDDFWEWDGLNWSQIPMAATPPARADHSLAFDEARARLVLFGGRGVSGSLDDTWEWDGGGWRRIELESWPSRRAQHATLYDSSRNRILLYGGVSGTLVRKDFWEYPNPATYVISRTTVGPAVDVAVAWGDGVFAVLREVGTGPSSGHWIVLNRLDVLGNPLDASVTVSSGYSPMVASGGGRFGLVFQDVAGFLPRIFFASLLPDGVFSGTPEIIGTLPSFDHVAYGDLEYGDGVFAFVSDSSLPGQPGGGVAMTRILPEGGTVGDPTQISARSVDGLPAIAFGGDLFGVTWWGEQSLRFSVVDGDGVIQFPQDQKMLDIPECYDPRSGQDGARIAWNESGFGFYLNPACDDNVLFAAITPEGPAQATAIRTRGADDGDLLGIAMAWDGRWYGVADNETYGSVQDRRLTFWRFWSDGLEREVGKRVPLSAGAADAIAMEWNGEAFGLAWVEDGTAYFGLIREASPPPPPTPTPTHEPQPTRQILPSFPRGTQTYAPERTGRPTIAIAWTPIPPDRNLDGLVDHLDLFMLAKEYGEGLVRRGDLSGFVQSFHQPQKTPTHWEPFGSTVSIFR